MLTSRKPKTNISGRIRRTILRALLHTLSGRRLPNISRRRGIFHPIAPIILNIIPIDTNSRRRRSRRTRPRRRQIRRTSRNRRRIRIQHRRRPAAAAFDDVTRAVAAGADGVVVGVGAIVGELVSAGAGAGVDGAEEGVVGAAGGAGLDGEDGGEGG